MDSIMLGRRWIAGLWHSLAVLCLAVLAGCSSLSGASRHDAAAIVSASPTATGASVRFTDITEKAGIRFQQQSSKTPRKYLIETFGSGCAFIDYDGDGWQDILLLNNT